MSHNHNHSTERFSPPVKTCIFYLLDRSGSMASIRNATVEGFNTFIEGQKSAGINACISLYQFDSPYRGLDTLLDLNPVYVSEDVKNVTLMTNDDFVPRGNTPLYDAIMKTIEIADGTANKGRVLFVIHTDGENNDSKINTRDQVFKKISEYRGRGWEFVYLGANQDAYAVGAGLGVSRGSTFFYQSTPLGTKHLFNTVSASAINYAGGRSEAGNFFSDAEESKVT